MLQKIIHISFFNVKKLCICMKNICYIQNWNEQNWEQCQDRHELKKIGIYMKDKIFFGKKKILQKPKQQQSQTKWAGASTNTKWLECIYNIYIYILLIFWQQLVHSQEEQAYTKLPHDWNIHIHINTFKKQKQYWAQLVPTRKIWAVTNIKKDCNIFQTKWTFKKRTRKRKHSGSKCRRRGRGPAQYIYTHLKTQSQNKYSNKKSQS